MKKNRFYLYYIVLVAGIVLIIMGYLFGDSAIIHAGNSVETKKVTTDTVTQISAEERLYTFDLYQEGQAEYSEMSLVFYTNHQDVTVSADGRELYSMKSRSQIWGHTTGPAWNFVELPVGTRHISVLIKALYPEVRDTQQEFYIGNELQIYHSLIKSSAVDIILSSLIVLAGLVMIIYWAVVRRHTNVGTDMLYLGLFAVLLGSWMFNETDGAALIIRNRVGASFMAFMLLALMGMPFALFVRDFFRIGEHFWWKVLGLLSTLNVIGIVLLQFVGIADMKRTVPLTHAILVMALLYLIGTMICKIIRHEIDRKWYVNLIGVIVLSLSTAFDLMAYYSGLHIVDAIGKYGFLLYVLLLGREAAFESLTKIQEGRKAELYKQMATTDQLTKLYNRNAYDEFIGNHVNDKTYTIVLMDLNNLKKTNDTLGHIIGDQYLTDSAAVIKEVFGVQGSCFRIGGDEFCVFIQKDAGSQMERLIRRLREMETDYNQGKHEFRMQIACGYAVYDRCQDESIEDTRVRADECMYQNKKELKKLAVLS